MSAGIFANGRIDQEVLLSAFTKVRRCKHINKQAVTFKTGKSHFFVKRFCLLEINSARTFENKNKKGHIEFGLERNSLSNRVVEFYSVDKLRKTSAQNEIKCHSVGNYACRSR